MKDIRICIIRGPGTNCDRETKEAVEHFGVSAEVVHINRFMEEKKRLADYHGLIIPGGFSYGDHIRSGAILGKILGEKFSKAVGRLLDEGKPVLGICNGFQVLVESGILPGFEGISPVPEAALGTNNSSRFEDRWVYLRKENKGKCIFTEGMEDLTRMPVAHGEGKLILPEGSLERLRENDQVVFVYATENGEAAGGAYPANPNGSVGDIAGICDPSGTVLGMMPHPERAFHRITYPDWTRTGLEGVGDGYAVFENMVEYLGKRF